MKATMRKSRYVTFLLAGVAAAGLSACDQTEDAMLYSDPASCAKEMDAGACNEAYTAARAEHIQAAPKFANQAECEAAGFAQCEQAEVKTAEGATGATSGGSFFMPMMMGYMMGRMMSPGMAPSIARPVYADRSGYLHARGANVGRMPAGATSLGPSGIATRVTTRGGFGGGARGFSGGA